MKTLYFILFIILVNFTSSYFAQNVETQKQFHHVLLFKWAENMDTSIKTEIMTLFKGLPAKIEGFNSISIEDMVMSSDGFDSIFIMRFDSKEAQDIYQEHPDHKRIQAIAQPFIAKFSKFDYWE